MVPHRPPVRHRGRQWLSEERVGRTVQDRAYWVIQTRVGSPWGIDVVTEASLDEVLDVRLERMSVARE
jgi:hypothetical protein